MTTLSILHCSDLHFGQPAVPAQYEALERLVLERKFDVVAISGDVSQRARAGEFQRARVLIQQAEAVSRVIVVPGNHDVAWWFSPLGLGRNDAMLRKYRRYISQDLEPVLRVPGAVIAGVNTAQGVRWETLTRRPRDISIIGHLGRDQVDRLRRVLEDAPAGAARVVVMHHNVLKGELSQRYGLKHTRQLLTEFAAMGVDLVLCGHDHQEAVRAVEHTDRGLVVSTAGTVSDRSRGGRPSSVNTVQVTDGHIDVATLAWSDADRAFVPGPSQRFPRTRP
ncbi:MAG TPA: metallophosphoesterase [Gemmatimonadaceae bacterium]|nr:metallophosphoesterase [Gemmatimonadaceae bacterium]